MTRQWQGNLKWISCHETSFASEVESFDSKLDHDEFDIFCVYNIIYIVPVYGILYTVYDMQA